MKLTVCLAAAPLSTAGVEQLRHKHPQEFALLLRQVAAQHQQTGAQAMENLARALNTLEKMRYVWPNGVAAGKKMDGCVYLHKSETWPPEAATAAQYLPKDFVWDVFVWYHKPSDAKKTGVVAFVSVPDWNTSHEPQRASYENKTYSSVSVYPNGTTTYGNSTAIYHHKWQFVSDNSTVMDVPLEKIRSLRWWTAALLDDAKLIGQQAHWQKATALLPKKLQPYEQQPLPLSTNLWATTTEHQEVGSAGTSLNQVPDSYKFIKDSYGWQPHTRNADIGGGRFDAFTQQLATHQVENVVFDPFNRSAAHNAQAAAKIANGQAYTVTCNNVLNVIREQASRELVIRQAANALRPDGSAFFVVYTGGARRNTGFGSYSRKGWQENKHARAYVPEISKWFGHVKTVKDFIVATQPKK